MANNLRPLRLLFSARDPAAAHAIGNLARQACSDSRFLVRIIASPPASEMLTGVHCKCLSLSRDTSENLQQLTSVASQMLIEYHPDAVISGASGPDVGIDEVLVKQAKQVSGIGTYIIQDFWGDVNLSLGAAPDCYFVVDKIASELTRQRAPSDTCIVGSVKHANYGSMDVTSLRTRGRNALGVDGKKSVIGYFGMPLGGLSGYWRTLKTLVDAIQSLPVRLIYRPHPKENEQMRNRTRKIFKPIGRLHEDQGVSVEETLAACDLILSCYSSCGIDSELLGRNTGKDNRLSVFLLYDEEILDYYQRYTLLDDLPPSLLKRSVTITDRSKLRDTLENFLAVESRLDFLSSASPLPSAGESVSQVLDKVYHDSRL